MNAIKLHDYSRSGVGRDFMVCELHFVVFLSDHHDVSPHFLEGCTLIMRPHTANITSFYYLLHTDDT